MKIPFAYTWRSLWARRLTTALTLTGLALVAFVFAAVLMLSRGVENTLIETGSPDNAIVLRKSANSELVSQIDRDGANIIKTFPEVAYFEWQARSHRPDLPDQPAQARFEHLRARRVTQRANSGRRSA
jgi:hypothetical protein